MTSPNSFERSLTPLIQFNKNVIIILKIALWYVSEKFIRPLFQLAFACIYSPDLECSDIALPYPYIRIGKINCYTMPMIDYWCNYDHVCNETFKAYTTLCVAERYNQGVTEGRLERQIFFISVFFPCLKFARINHQSVPLTDIHQGHTTAVVWFQNTVNILQKTCNGIKKYIYCTALSIA